MNTKKIVTLLFATCLMFSGVASLSYRRRGKRVNPARKKRTAPAKNLRELLQLFQKNEAQLEMIQQRLEELQKRNALLTEAIDIEEKQRGQQAAAEAPVESPRRVKPVRGRAKPRLAPAKRRVAPGRRVKPVRGRAKPRIAPAKRRVAPRGRRRQIKRKRPVRKRLVAAEAEGEGEGEDEELLMIQSAIATAKGDAPILPRLLELEMFSLERIEQAATDQATSKRMAPMARARAKKLLQEIAEHKEREVMEHEQAALERAAKMREQAALREEQQVAAVQDIKQEHEATWTEIYNGLNDHYKSIAGIISREETHPDDAK